MALPQGFPRLQDRTLRLFDELLHKEVAASAEESRNEEVAGADAVYYEQVEVAKVLVSSAA